MLQTQMLLYYNYAFGAHRLDFNGMDQNDPFFFYAKKSLRFEVKIMIHEDIQ